MREMTRYVVAIALIVALGALRRDRGRSRRRTGEPSWPAAGFQMKPADTAERVAHLQTLTPAQARAAHRTRDGKLLYVYADPKGCQCLYVGDEAAYQRYQQLAHPAEARTGADDGRADERRRRHELGPLGPVLVVSRERGESSMQLGMIGLGRMGANMVLRLMRAGHKCVVYDVHPEAVQALVKEGAVGATSLEDLVGEARQAAGRLADGAGGDRRPGRCRSSFRCSSVTIRVIDGGNSYYHDDIRRAKELAPKGLHYVDVGTSGGVWGLERGYCQMIGGESGRGAASRSDLRGAGARQGRRARPRPAVRAREPPSRATCTAGHRAPGTSSRWCTTASSTGSWRRTPRG